MWDVELTRPSSTHDWLYADANPLNYVDPSGQFACRYRTHADEDNYIRRKGWDYCGELPEMVIGVLGSDPSRLTSHTLWEAIRRYDPQLRITYYGGADIHGSRPLFGNPFLEIPSGGVPLAAAFRQRIVNPTDNDLVYISAIAHEFWHATMQIPQTQGLGLGEADAWAAQALILEELGASPWHVEQAMAQARDYWNRSFGEAVLEGMITCSATLVSTSMFDQYYGLRVLLSRAEWKDSMQ